MRTSSDEPEVVTRVLRRLAPSAGVILVALGLSGCPQITAIWIAPGSTRDRLTFNFGRDRGVVHEIAIGRILVGGCVRDSTGKVKPVWDIWHKERAVELDHVLYGASPDGFNTVVGAKSLDPGCYTAEIGGTGGFLQFKVDSNGAVIDQGAPKWTQ